MTIAAHTLGCKLNYAETSDTLRKLASAGHKIVDFGQHADLYIINTCTVTSVAEKKCRTAIRQAHRLNPDAKIVVMGCFAQVAAGEIEKIPGVTLVLGNDRKHLLPEIVGSGERKVESGKRKVESWLTRPPLTQSSNQAIKQSSNQAITDAPATNTITQSHNNTITNAITQSNNNATTNTFPLQYSSAGGPARTRTFFKIQDGCDYFCTYCAIPFARGRSRSATIDETLCMARRIADEGAHEVVLTGVNTGTFGLHQGENFLDLLRGLDKIEGILRYRISSIEPNLLTDDIISFVASSRAFLPHFHIPLQAGSDHVLALMHRHYDTALYRAKLERIKAVMPDACIAADIMAGFNGENEEEFQKTLAFVDSLPISYLHVFTYSDRPGTAALRLGEKIPIPVRHEHTARLLELSEQKHRAFIQSQLGKTRPVLWESKQVESGKRKAESGKWKVESGKLADAPATNAIKQSSNQAITDAPATNTITQSHNNAIANTLHSPLSTFMEGWTDNYIRVCRPYDAALAGTVENVTLSADNILRDEIQ